MQNNYENHVKTIFNLMQETKLFAKTICSPIGNNESWDLLIDQLKDPKNVRHIRGENNKYFNAKADNNIDRTQYYDTKTAQWTKRTVHQQRGLPKETRFTKKTSVSLLPPDGKMFLFAPNTLLSPDETLCLLWDSTQCDLKDEKFIFSENANTHSRWWLGRENPGNNKEHLLRKTMRFEDLQNQLIDHKKNRDKDPNIKALNNNDVSVCLSKEALIGIAAVQHTLANKLHAIEKKCYIKKNLNIDLPIFIITPQQGLEHYSEMLQHGDIAIAKQIQDKKLSLLLQNIGESYINSLKNFKNEEAAEQYDETQRNKLFIRKNYFNSDSVVKDSIKQKCKELAGHTDKEIVINFLRELSLENSANYSSIIYELLDYGINFKAYDKSFFSMQIGFEEIEEYCDIELEQAYIENFHVLTASILHSHSNRDVFELILKKYPNYIVDIIKNIRELYQKLPSLHSTKFPCESTCVQEAYVKLLMSFSSEQTKFVTNEDKRVLETYLINKIQKTISIQDIFNQYETYLYTPTLQKRRIFSFYKNPDYPTSLINIIQALQKRAVEIAHNSCQKGQELENLKNNELFSPQHLKKGVSRHQYNVLNKMQHNDDILKCEL